MIEFQLVLTLGNVAPHSSGVGITILIAQFMRIREQDDQNICLVF